MRGMLAVIYLIWVGWLIRKSEADEKAVKWVLGQFDALTARASRTVIAERARIDLTRIDAARVEHVPTPGSFAGTVRAFRSAYPDRAAAIMSAERDYIMLLEAEEARRRG